MPVTIRDVAREAGVAPSTVSRVLAGNPRISPATQARVREAMRLLNYQPHAVARSLARRATHLIGLMVARPAEQAFANPFFPELLRGVGRELESRGFSLLLSTSDDEREEARLARQLVRSRRVDGLILTSARRADPLLAELASERFPFVLIGRSDGVDGVTWVDNDNAEVGRVATHHLIERGHRRIAFVGGPRHLVVTLDRRTGYRSALAEAGIPLDRGLELHCDFSREGGRAAAERLLSLLEPPTAVFAADDQMAVGVLLCLRERGLAGPGGVAVVGVNDDPMSALISPSLSSVQIPVADLGSTAARLLLDALARPELTGASALLPCRLIPRQSSDWPLQRTR